MIRPLPHSTMANDSVVPICARLTDALERPPRSMVITGSMTPAACQAAGFASVGKLVFTALGITMGDFPMAAGATSDHHIASVSSPTLGDHR